MHDCPPFAPEDYLVWDVARTAKKEHDTKGRIPPCKLDLLTNDLNNIAARELCYLLCYPIYKVTAFCVTLFISIPNAWPFRKHMANSKHIFCSLQALAGEVDIFFFFFNRALIVWSMASKLSLSFWFLKRAALLCLGT